MILEGFLHAKNEEILHKTREYIDSCEDEDRQLVKQSNEGKGYEMYENKIKVNLPTIEGLALYLKVPLFSSVSQ